MATFRKLASGAVNARPATFIYHDFPSYNEALTFSRANNAHKPLRLDFGARWRVATLNPVALGKAPRADYAKLPHWVPPFRGYCDAAAFPAL